jgi:hypothetical protein
MREKLWVRVVLSVFFFIFFNLKGEELKVCDKEITEDVYKWGIRYVEDFAVSKDAKVGKYSITGIFPFTTNIYITAPVGFPWNLTKYEGLRFWAKSDKENAYFLVMLKTKGGDQRDAVIYLSKEWKLFELPFREEVFSKNVQGKFDFRKVKEICIYNNSGEKVRIWIDGFEFYGEKEGIPIGTEEVFEFFKEKGKAKKVLDIDPKPYRNIAEGEKYKIVSRYDLPPLTFNKENSFKDALVNFNEIKNWEVIFYDCEGYAALSYDQTLRGVPTLKIEIIPQNKHMKIILIPEKPIKINKEFDCIEGWIYGHKEGTAEIGMALCLQTEDKRNLIVGKNITDNFEEAEFIKIPSRFWNIARYRLTQKIEKNTNLVAIYVDINLSEKYTDPTFLLHLDQLRVFLFDDYMKNPAPKFKNTGKIVSNFPTRKEGACPITKEKVKTGLVYNKSGEYIFFYKTEKDKVKYIYKPETGTFSDIKVEFENGDFFYPAYKSGPIFDFDGKIYEASLEENQHISTEIINNKTLRTIFRYKRDKFYEDIIYEISLEGKTLRISAYSSERYLCKWDFGCAKNVKEPRIIDVPFMNYSPNVLLTHGYFVTYYTDWYFTNCSMFPYTSDNYIKNDEARYTYSSIPGNPNAGYVYWKKTNGLRHLFREIFYITVSKNFDEVLITPSNPPSPMKEVLKKYIYKMVCATDKGIFKKARDFVDLCDEYGITNIYFLFHAPLFFKRYSGCEPFPGDMKVSILHQEEGGDEGLKNLFEYMKEKGWRPGYYDGYPSRAFTSYYFHYDWTSYLPDGNWKYMWAYPALKPWAFPELANTLYKERAKKFKPLVSYQDGITAWIITYMNDFDHRYPESGILRDTMKALATGWQRVRENVNGPVFSEGGGREFYIAGLNDGDYGKLKGYWDEKPCNEDRVELLVDFKLKKLNPLSPGSVGINVGYAGFAGTNKIDFYSWLADEKNYNYLHHYLATQIAFGVIGILDYWVLWDNPKHLFDKTLTEYFMIQQIQERYIMEEVEEIKYFDGEKLLDTSEALRKNVVKENMVYIKYKNGLTIYINCNWDNKNWIIEVDGKKYILPPGGWFAKQNNDFIEYSCLLEDGKRIDYVDSPAYTYLNGYGRKVNIDGFETDKIKIKFKKGKKVGKVVVFIY